VKTPFSLATRTIFPVVAMVIAVLAPYSGLAAPLIFTHSNVPLGITIEQFKRQYPNCRVSADSDENTNGFEPLTGYNPPFLDLLPNYQGSFLAVGPPAEQMSDLGDGYFAFFAISCRDGKDRAKYTAAVYHAKIAVITKTDTESGQGSAEQVITRLRSALTGKVGPVHKASSVLGQVFQGQGLDDFVTYGDDGNVRTVVEADNTLVAGGDDQIPVHVAYIDLGLWNLYNETIQAKLKAMSEEQNQGAEKVQKEL
jgi:hypothetical protein